MQEEKQNEPDCRHMKQYDFNTLVWTENFGIRTGVDMALEGSHHESGFYNETDPFC